MREMWSIWDNFEKNENIYVANWENLSENSKNFRKKIEKSATKFWKIQKKFNEFYSLT